MSNPRMYAELARWWPLLSPVEEYLADAALIGGLLSAGGREVSDLLELGSGGGHVAVHLSSGRELTLVDLSEDMLAVSRRLNPACEHIVGDMRTVRLGCTFDAVLVHDAIDYMLTEDDLTAVFSTAAAHLSAGGIFVLLPDHVRETFAPGTGHGGTDTDDGSGIRYLEWTHDPDPTDDEVVTEYGYLVREADGSMSWSAETHRFGLFARQRWMDLLGEAGFEATSLLEQTGNEKLGNEQLEDEQLEGERLDDDPRGRMIFVATLR